MKLIISYVRLFMIISHMKIITFQTIINYSFWIFYIDRKDRRLYNKKKYMGALKYQFSQNISLFFKAFPFVHNKDFHCFSHFIVFNISFTPIYFIWAKSSSRHSHQIELNVYSMCSSRVREQNVQFYTFCSF